MSEAGNDSGSGRAHSEPAVGRGGGETGMLNRHLMAQHQHRVELGFAHPPNLAWDLSM